MGIRRTAIDEASRRTQRQLDDLVRDLRDARLAAGLSQAAVAHAVHLSPQWVALLEKGNGATYVLQLARWGAAVGLD
ncbi:MAG: helix-turn-helix domain-containing protein, partial [Chloroflexi bacterium]